MRAIASRIRKLEKLQLQSVPDLARVKLAMINTVRDVDAGGCWTRLQSDLTALAKQDAALGMEARRMGFRPIADAVRRVGERR
jgi:hypothetical protein